MPSPFSFSNAEQFFGKKPCLLLVDDVPGNLKILMDILSGHYKLLAATNGYNALEIAKNNSPDLILLDIVMPEMDGYEVCQRLKENKETANIPVIFISGLNETTDKVKSFQVGGVDYISKPFQIEEVKARVTVQLKLRESQRGLETLNLELNEYLNIIDKYVLITCTNTKGVITSASQSFCENTGYHADDLIGQNHNILRHPQTPEQTYKDLWQTIANGKIWEGEIQISHKSGSLLWHQVQISPTHNSLGELVGYTGIRQDITAKKRVEALSMSDELTGLFNRRKFNVVFPILMKRARRDSSWFCFMLLDIDYFKKYNDTYGHPEGDNALALIGKILSQQLLRESDFAFRLGGEEFGILISTKKGVDAKILAESIRQAVQDSAIKHSENKVASCITVSLGYWVGHNENLRIEPKKIYELADKALYIAKKNGRNRIQLATGIDLNADSILD